MASTESLIAYYAKLLILQYRQKPKAVATIKAYVQPVIMDQLPVAVQNAYALDTAIGVQLDILGKYVGISRMANTFSGPISLNDSDYRQLIRIKIIQNNSGSSLATIQQFLHDNFSGTVQVFDYTTMRLSYFISPSIGSVQLAQVLVKDGLLPKPMGVQISVVYVPDLTNIFGFRSYKYANTMATPFNSYTDYHTDYKWLSYKDTLST